MQSLVNPTRVPSACRRPLSTTEEYRAVRRSPGRGFLCNVCWPRCRSAARGGDVALVLRAAGLSR